MYNFKQQGNYIYIDHVDGAETINYVGLKKDVKIIPTTVEPTAEIYVYDITVLYEATNSHSSKQLVFDFSEVTIDGVAPTINDFITWVTSNSGNFNSPSSGGTGATLASELTVTPAVNGLSNAQAVLTDHETRIDTLETSSSSIIDAGSLITATTVEGALAENRGLINTNTATVADHEIRIDTLEASSVITTTPLAYGRVRANLDLASTTHINTDPGTKIPFTISTYLSGMTDNAGSLIPSISGRYRADWLCMASSTDFEADGIFHVVQNGVSVGQTSYNMNQASAVNQCAGFIDVDLVAGVEVSLHYRTRHTASDSISWDRGSYFQLTQLPTDITVIGGGSSTTNLTTTQAPTTVTVNSDTGTDATIVLANGTNAGVSTNDYTTAEKSKLAGIDLVEYAKYDIATGNLLNTANIIENSVINTSGNLQSGLSNYSCILIDCKENTNYTYSGFTLASSTTRVLFLNASNTKISDIDLDTTTGTFKTPVGCTKFYFNTKWNGVSSYSTNQIEEGEVATAYVDYTLTKLNASNIADNTLYIEKFENSFLAPDKNILDQFSITESTVVNTGGDLQTGASNYSAIKINCMENTDYAYSGFTLTGQIRVLYLNDSNAKISSELLPDISGTFTTPIGCVAFWFNTKWNGTSSYATNQIEEGSVATSYASYSLKTLNRNKFQHSIPALPEVISAIKGRLTSLETNGTPHPFNGKIINFLGDSISTVGSSGASTTGTNYFNVFGTSIGASLVRAYGVAGNTITGGFTSRYAAMDSNADLIVVFGGVNDFITGQTLGTITDTGSSTFYGSVNTLMSGLLSKYNGKDIIFMTPMHNVGDQTPNSVGLVLQDYSKAITACGLKWGIPILDLTANLGINANVTTGYYVDGTHPSDAGHSRIAAKLVKYTNIL